MEIYYDFYVLLFRIQVSYGVVEYNYAWSVIEVSYLNAEVE
jgi:hypothetical protein